MKKEELISLGVSEDVAEKVFALHDKGLEPYKTKLSTAEAEAAALRTQLTEASTTIEGFKALKPDELKAAADDYKARLEQAQQESAKQLSALKFDHALEGSIAAAKARNAKAVKALLDVNGLKFNEADGSILGLKEQLEEIKKESDYLFEGTQPPPKIVTGGNNQPVGEIPGIAAWRAAGFPDGPPKK